VDECNRHIQIPCDEYIKYHLAETEKRTDLKIKSLQLEYSKSELNYPTREDLDQQMKGMVTKADIKEKLDSLSVQMKLQWGFLVALLILFIADFLRK
jgi:hypothetical protein